MSENIETVQERALASAQKVNAQINTGFLLLGIVSGSGVATNILSTRKLTKRLIRAHLKEDVKNPFEESQESYDKVFRTATSIAKTVRTNTVSAVHLLAAIASVPQSIGYQIFVEEGIRADEIRVQAMRNMVSGLTREHGKSIQDNSSKLSSKNNSVNPASRRTSNKISQTSKTISSKRVSPAKTRGTRVKNNQSGFSISKHGMGSELEQVQKKTRQARNLSGVEDGAPVEEVYENDLFTLSPKDFPLLTSLGRNLTQEVREGTIRPVVGRVKEIGEVADCLNKKRANSPCLTGFPGVGKTAVIEGLAFDLVTRSVSGLDFETIVEVSVGNLLGGTSLRGELGDKIVQLTGELEKSEGKVLLFFDDVHNLLASADAKEAVVEIQSAMERGIFPSVWATSTDHYEQYVTDPSIAKLVTQVEIKEPSIDESIEIIAGIAPDYEEHHGVSIGEEVIKSAVILSNRYVPDTFLPDKAISIIDLAGAQVHRQNKEILELEDIAHVLAAKIGVPKDRLVASDGERLLELEKTMSKEIIGHDHVLEAIGETLRRNAAGFRSNRPIGSFMFLGPTGVGKTETAKALARLLFADEKAMIRLDMSEFSQPHAIARLIGAPPGYVGHEEGGQLTDAVSKRPYSLILLDEIEKAHRDVVLALLQVLDDGRLTDGGGKTVDFNNTVIIMTSNLGSDVRIQKEISKPVGFGQTPASNDAEVVLMKDSIIQSARAALPPELWNRIDEPLVFEPLGKSEINEIAKLMLSNLSKQIQKEKQFSIITGPGVIELLIARGGFDLELGARPMRRTISKLIEGPLAKVILSSEPMGDSIAIGCKDDELSFEWSNK